MKAIILILVSLSISAYCQQCKFSINGYRNVPMKPPLLIDPALKSIKYPDDLGYIVMNQNDPIGLLCGKFSKFNDLTYVTLYCKSGTNFFYFYKGQEKTDNIFDFTCESFPIVKTEVKNRGCMGTLQLIQVYFQFENTRLPLYTSCYDPNTCHVNYVKYTIKPIYHQMGHDFSWKRQVFACNVEFYKKENETETFKKIFDKDQRYIERNSFLSKGHIAAKVDFIYAAEQYASYLYINCAPEWQVINALGGNWYEAEDATRNLSMERNVELSIISGTFGVLKLPHQSGFKEIYLDYQTSRIPAPNFFYKVVLDEKNNEGVVIIVINNSFLRAQDFHDIRCNRQSLTWVTFYDNFEKGLAVACTVKDFIRAYGLNIGLQKDPARYRLLQNLNPSQSSLFF